MPKPRRKRVYLPKPSRKARERILAAIRELIGRDDWTMGFTVSLAALAALLAADPPGSRLTYPTLRLYLPWLARAGHLRRVCRGIYELPTTRIR